VDTLSLDDTFFYSVAKGVRAQFGVPADPSTSAYWSDHPISDDPVTHSNTRGALTFASSGRSSRTSKLFINLADNSYLDKQGFAPIGRVVEGMEVIDRVYNKYGEGSVGGSNDGPDEDIYMRDGIKYIGANYNRLTYIRYAMVTSDPPADIL
jgi:peptidyl-prolyl cis-trans isomerase A (cyclophilin A)